MPFVLGGDAEEDERARIGRKRQQGKMSKTGRERKRERRNLPQGLCMLLMEATKQKQLE
jgi:hypothetical protein